MSCAPGRATSTNSRRGSVCCAHPTTAWCARRYASRRLRLHRGLRVECLPSLRPVIGHAPVSREEVIDAGRRRRPGRDRGTLVIPEATSSGRCPDTPFGAAPFSCGPGGRRSRRAIPAEAEPANRDAEICLPIRSQGALTARLRGRKRASRDFRPDGRRCFKGVFRCRPHRV